MGVTAPSLGRPPSVIINPQAFEVYGSIWRSAINNLANVPAASAIWPVANLAIFIPFSVPVPCTIVKMYVENGSVVSGNIDLGIYDAAGTRLVSSGSTAQAGTSALQIIDTTDLPLAAGVIHYLAMAMDNGTGTTMASLGSISAGQLASLGMAQMATAFPLPATATLALMATNYLPFFGASQIVTF